MFRSMIFLLLVLLVDPIPALGQAKPGKTIVLVHGSFVGAWYWEPVIPGLRERGHTVIAPDLTGHGAHVADDPAGISLQQHIDDVVKAIRSSETPVILVSHSYGGRPATGAWDIVREHVEAVIFLEAVAPYGSGDLALPFALNQYQALEQLNPQAISAGLLEPPAYLAERYPEQPIQPQSIQALYGAVPLKRGPLPDTPGAYVIGTESEARIFRQFARKVQSERGWTVWDIETGHDMVHDNSDVVTRLIDKLARELPAPDSGP